MTGLETIRIGHGGTILVQLQAENMETGITGPLPEALMAAITRVRLVLTSGVVVDSEATGLGSGQPFDHEVDQTAAKLALTLGGAGSLVGKEGSYRQASLRIYFGNDLPIPFPIWFVIKIDPAE